MNPDDDDDELLEGEVRSAAERERCAGCSQLTYGARIERARRKASRYVFPHAWDCAYEVDEAAWRIVRDFATAPSREAVIEEIGRGPAVPAWVTPAVRVGRAIHALVGDQATVIWNLDPIDAEEVALSDMPYKEKVKALEALANRKLDEQGRARKRRRDRPDVGFDDIPF